MTLPEKNANSDGCGEAGLTLVELLVAITLFGILSLLLVDGLRFGIQVWNRGIDHSEQISEVSVVQNLLRRLIGDAYPQFIASDPTRPRIAFSGTPTSVRFLASAPVSLGSAGRMRITIAADHRATRTDLVMSAEPELAFATSGKAYTETTLLSGIQSVKFAYFGRKSSAKEPGWHDNWAREQSLPQLVRVRLQFPDRQVQFWPELIIKTRISIDTGCVYDALTKRCRGR